jgi:hypothetical protein
VQLRDRLKIKEEELADVGVGDSWPAGEEQPSKKKQTGVMGREDCLGF